MSLLTEHLFIAYNLRSRHRDFELLSNTNWVLTISF